jgi:hypothetical protein
MLALTAGEWAAWVAAVGTVLAFTATTWAIWSAHRLRLIEHSEAMFDEALKVGVAVSLGAEYVTESKPDGTKERLPHSKIVVTVTNRGRRPISGLLVRVLKPGDYLIGDGHSEFLQSGLEQRFSFDPSEDMWKPFGTSPVPDVLIRLTFTDFDGTSWHRYPDGRLVTLPRRRRPWQRSRRFLARQLRALESQGPLGRIVVTANPPSAIGVQPETSAEGDGSSEVLQDEG